MVGHGHFASQSRLLHFHCKLSLAVIEQATADTPMEVVGEEILVLEGTFSDEHGDFGAGTYFRNGPGSSHAPFSNEGCTLFVKLHQFLPDDRAQVCVDTSVAAWLPEEEGVEAMPLHRFAGERVMLMRWTAGARAQRQPGGEEIFVISGELKDELGTYPRGTWLRGPRKSDHTLYAEQESLAWIKTGHLFPGRP